MELPNNSPNLRGEVAGIHVGQAHSALDQTYPQRVKVYGVKEAEG